MPACPNCKASVLSPERMYNVTVEPEEGERGITKREVGMFRCPRCDTSFPRVLGKKHYLLVPEVEFTRLKEEVKDLTAKGVDLSNRIEAGKIELAAREGALRREIQKDHLVGLESELGQLEKHVKYLRNERDRLKKETE